MRPFALPRCLHRRRAAAGLTLVELMVAVGVIGVLIAIALPMFRGWQERMKMKQAQDDIIAMSMAIDSWVLDHNRAPDSLADVGRAGKLDPWGNAYEYLALLDRPGNGQARKDHSLVPLNTDYDLYSKGPDGLSSPPLTAAGSRDDILRANNGRFVGPASQY